MELNKLSTWVTIILATLLAYFVLRSSQLKQQADENAGLVESLNAELVVWKDKDSLNHAKITVIETSNTKTLLEIQSKDSTIQELQETVKKFEKKLKDRGNVSVVDNTTEVSVTVPTEVEKDSADAPVYKSDINLDNWIFAHTVANKDSTSLSIKVRNKYAIIIGEEPQGWFKKPIPFAEVINYNPYTETKSLRTYQVTVPKPKKFGLGIMAGYMLDDNFNFKPAVGVGISYNLIRF